MAGPTYDDERLSDSLDPARFEQEFADNTSKPGFKYTGDGENDNSEAQALSPEQLQGAENTADSATSSATSQTQANLSGGYWAGAAQAESTGGGRFSRLVKSSLSGRRKYAVGGGGMVAVLLTVILGVGTVVPFELVHIEKTLVKYEAKVEQRVEKKVAQKMLQEMVCRKLAANNVAIFVPSCKKAPPENTEDASKQQAEENTPDADGNTPKLAAEIDNFDITSPAVVDSLAKNGITVETDPITHTFKGLTDSATGKDITGDVATDANVFNRIETALPEWDIGQLESFRALLVDHAGVSLEGLPPDSASETPDQEIVNDIEKGATGQDEVNAQAEVNEQPNPAEQSAPPNPQGVQEAAADTGPLSDSISAAENTLAKTGSAAQATDAATSTFMSDIGGNLGNKLLASSVATTICSVENAAEHAEASRIPQIMNLLVRHTALVFSTAGQLQDGKVPEQGLNGLMQVLDGDQPGSSSNSGAGSTINLPWTSSAADMRISGNPVNSDPHSPGYTPDINRSSLPTLNSGSKVVLELKSLMGKTGGSLVCKALNSPLGIFVQGAIGLGQAAVDIGSFGTTQALLTGGLVAFQETMQRVVVPEIVSYFTPVGLAGTESGAQFFNNTDAGTNIAFNDYARRLGGNPQTTAQANAETAAASQDPLSLSMADTWTNRTFALSNPNSLLSHLANYLPVDSSRFFANLAGYFASLPNALSHDFASLFSGSLVKAQAPPTNPGDAYGLTQYAFNDTELNNAYPAIANELYLHTTISATVCHPTPNGCQYYQVSDVRLHMLGDPTNKATVGNNEDYDSNDLLHCYVNNYADFSDNQNPTPSSLDPICKSVGNYDLTNEAPVVPDDASVATVYCRHLQLKITTPGDYLVNCPTDGSGTGELGAHIDNDANRFRQYIANVHVVGDYKSLTNNL